MTILEMSLTDSTLSIPIGDEVHLWHFRCDQAVDETILSEDERARAARYTLDAPRREFMIGRWTLRTVLGRYLHVDPKTIAFSLQSGGKPSICNVEHLYINVSHSAGCGVIAVASKPVGVDIEQVRDMPNAEGLVARFFAAEEREQFAALPLRDRRLGFFRGWTGKEALLKAVGVGLAGVEQVAVDLDPTRPARILRFDNRDDHWHIMTWQPEPDFIITVALQNE